MNIFVPAFLIGLAGSLHCVGMCSPLAMTVSSLGKQAFTRNLLYNSGRILTYGIMGAAISLVGAGLNIAGVQQWVSLIVGALLLLIAIYNLTLKLPAFVNRAASWSINLLKAKFSKGVARAGNGGTVLLGMINGLLPCGLTLAGLSYCITLSQPVDGFIAMLFFGLGTLPAMTGLAIALKTVAEKFKLRYKTIQTSLLIVSAILLIARGSSNFGVAHGLHETPTDIAVCGEKAN